jgi:hypothetical protein
LAARRRKFSKQRSYPKWGMKMVAYEFYRRVLRGEDRLIGVLPETRKDPEGITHDSIMRWAKILAPEDSFNNKVYFVRVEIR